MKNQNTFFNIDYPDLLKKYFNSGINVFAGAGFSTLSNAAGEKLPLGDKLTELLCEHFSFDNKYKYKLPRVVDLLKRRVNEEKIREFLTAIFTQKDYNPLYDNILKLNVKNFITTNIDNIFRLVVNNSDSLFINDILEEGEVIDTNKINYVPLHGDVTKNDFDYLFASSELSQAAKINPVYFSNLQTMIGKYPTIFIGYSFNDSSVFDTILNSNIDPSKVWILVDPDENAEAEIAYYREQNYNVILGSTEDFLKWLNDYIPSDKPNINTHKKIKYAVPDVATLPSISQASYYQDATTNWYSIIQKHPIHTHYFNEIANLILQERVLVITGIQFSGKTTLAMQLAKSFENRSYYIKNLSSIGQSEYILRNLSKDTIIFIDDFTNNIVAFQNLVQKCGNKIVGFAENYSFEVSKHLLPMKYKVCDISELNNHDFIEIYNKVPVQIRRFKLAEIPRSSTMTECIHLNVKNVITREKILKLLKKLYNSDIDCFKLMGLTAYLTSNRSVLSMDILISFFNNYQYDKIYSLINKLKGYLQEVDFEDQFNDLSQDYYNLRSNLFASLCNQCFVDYYSKDYSIIIKDFIFHVHYSNIVDYKVFVRTAYDAKRFHKVFGTNADEIYEYIYNYQDRGYNDIYTLQQWAQYNGLLKNYPRAFELIHEARVKGKRNLSIENTYACLLFDNNQNKGIEAIELLHNAMEILQNCYINDKRKDSHAKAFGRFALILYKQYKINDYLELAKGWLDEIKLESIRQDQEVDSLLKQLKAII